MSIIKMVGLVCDGCGTATPPDFDSDTAAETRRNARADGWVYRKGQDLCDVCRGLAPGMLDRSPQTY